jgi:hypothetical protein
MKNYGHNGRLKPEKKKKRKFEVIVNTATQGIYSGFTPMKVAKKVTSELVGKKKQIIFHLREKGKSGKTYGPYIGNIRDEKVVVRTHKMSGGIGEPKFTNIEKPRLFAKNGVNPIKTVRKEDEYFICFFGVLDQSPNYKYFVYFNDKPLQIKFYIINPDNSFTEVIDLNNIPNDILISLIQSLESKKNKKMNSINDFIINAIIKEITDKIPNIKNIITAQKKLKELQSPNYINNTKDSCIFYSPGIEDFKASNTANISSIKRRKFCSTRQTLLFFTQNKFIEYNGNKYFRFVIFHEWNNVLLEELELKNNKLIKKKILISEIDEMTLQRIKAEIERIKGANVKNKNFAEKILKSVESEIELKKKQKQQPQLKTNQQQITAQSLALMHPIFKNPTNKRSVPSSTAPTIPAQQPQQNSIIQPYICPIDNPIKEFKLSSSNEIFFGFNLDLLKIILPTFYYKYSYRGDKKFYQLEKQSNKPLTESKEIQIWDIPLYDLLCLYEFAKDRNLTDLVEKIKDHILQRQNKTAPNSKETIVTLSNSNFKVNKNTNIGKIKGKVEIMNGKRKTYYFFGKSNGKFQYVCYQEGEGNKEKVYYYEQSNLKEIKELSQFTNRLALEDLKSFIILRRMKNPKDKEFGKEVYEKASERIGQLKYQEIQNRINSKSNQSPQLPVQFQQSLAQFPVQSPVQFPVQPQKSNDSFLKYFNSFIPDTRHLPFNEKPQLQQQLKLQQPSTLVV